MIKEFFVQNMYLYIPVKAGEDTVTIEMYRSENGVDEKVYELEIPMNRASDAVYPTDYYAPVLIKQFMGKTIKITGDFTEKFAESLVFGNTDISCKEGYDKFIKLNNELINNECKKAAEKSRNRPQFHFTPVFGWMNDPNGLVYNNGCYHMYFQYNPYDVKWNNMCWGHAVSKDLLSWEQLETTIYPDENGMMFSGSGIRNEHGLLGLPKDALLFFYSAAGNFNQWSKDKTFTQRIAYSLDNGNTLQKLKTPFVDTICKENRDPKVFWHEETKAYIMVIWLEENDFAILRSSDLCQWEQSDRITLKGTWECPDLFTVKDEDGIDRWVFTAADGIYFWGDFDGYRFVTTGESHAAYFTDTLYAAQTYSGVSDRRIFIPWLRLENRGELCTGAMGIPRELTAVHKGGKLYLRQKPVREFEALADCKGLSVFAAKQLETGVTVAGKRIRYDSQNGVLTIGEERFNTVSGADNISVLVDGKIMEIFIDDGIMTGAFWI